VILNKVHFDVGLDSRIAIVGSNGAGKSTLYVLVTSCLFLNFENLRVFQDQVVNRRIVTARRSVEPEWPITRVSLTLVSNN
jgi:ABC-type molybdenum transport system ATPase subunit/photorepair protein PhrA